MGKVMRLLKKIDKGLQHAIPGVYSPKAAKQMSKDWFGFGSQKTKRRAKRKG